MGDKFVPVVSQFVTLASFSFSDVEDSLNEAKELVSVSRSVHVCVTCVCLCVLRGDADLCVLPSEASCRNRLHFCLLSAAADLWPLAVSTSYGMTPALFSAHGGSTGYRNLTGHTPWFECYFSTKGNNNAQLVILRHNRLKRHVYNHITQNHLKMGKKIGF